MPHPSTSPLTLTTSNPPTSPHTWVIPQKCDNAWPRCCRKLLQGWPVGSLGTVMYDAAGNQRTGQWQPRVATESGTCRRRALAVRGWRRRECDSIVNMLRHKQKRLGHPKQNLSKPATFPGACQYVLGYRVPYVGTQVSCMLVRCSRSGQLSAILDYESLCRNLTFSFRIDKKNCRLGRLDRKVGTRSDDSVILLSCTVRYLATNPSRHSIRDWPKL